jgi:hypothetical protein
MVFATLIDKIFSEVWLMSVKQAIERFGDRAKEAIEKELRQLHEKNVWSLVNVTDWKSCFNIIPSHMIVTKKFHPDGSHDKIKGRFVSGGNHEVRRLYEDNYSSTVSLVVVFIILAIVVLERRFMRIVDIVAAYLNALIKNKDILMRLNKQAVKLLEEMFPDLYNHLTIGGPDGSAVVKLLKALYGCRESAKLWYQHLRNTLESLGFKVNPYDICVFNKICNWFRKKNYCCCVY